MGAHRIRKSEQTKKVFCSPVKLPQFPCNIGKTKSIPTIDGRTRHLKIEDEIIRLQSNSNKKIIVFQKMRFLEEDRVEFRFGYYMIGFKPKRRGKWVWGQFCLLIPQEDLMALMQEAKGRKWFRAKNSPKS